MPGKESRELTTLPEPPKSTGILQAGASHLSVWPAAETEEWCRYPAGRRHRSGPIACRPSCHHTRAPSHLSKEAGGMEQE